MGSVACQCSQITDNGITDYMSSSIAGWHVMLWRVGVFFPELRNAFYSGCCFSCAVKCERWANCWGPGQWICSFLYSYAHYYLCKCQKYCASAACTLQMCHVILLLLYIVVCKCVARLMICIKIHDMLIFYALHYNFYCNLLDLVECDSSAFGEFRLRQLQRFFHLCSR